MPVEEAVRQVGVKVAFSSDGRSDLTCVFTNDSAGPLTIEMPSGMVARSADGQRVSTICPVAVTIEPHKSMDVIVPAVPLASLNGVNVAPYSITKETVAELQPLLVYSTGKDDLPRCTLQLTALLLLEDVSLERWEAFSRKGSNSSADVAVMIDALGLARTLKPGAEFKLARDPGLRLKAIRNPVARPKALKLFGLEDPDGAGTPGIDALLHTGAGDNCPICRMRAKAADPTNGL